MELRDGDKTRYLGKGVLKAVENVNTVIKNAIKGKAFKHVRELDEVLLDLDGTKTKSKLGANAILGVSMAFVVACAKANNKPLFAFLSEGKGITLPVPMMNVING